MKKSGFFCVSPEHVRALTQEDVRTLIAYLVMACGTGRDNITTSWSANSVMKYAHMRWGSANEAIGRLVEMGIVAKDTERSRPRHPSYNIQGHATNQEGQIWLPRALVEGVDPTQRNYPLRRIRQTNDTLLLRLLLDLYEHQDLTDWGGVSPQLICTKPTAVQKIDAKGGVMAVWGFETQQPTAWPALFGLHETTEGTAAFWKRFDLLKSFGFLEEVALLLDREGGEVLYQFTPNDPEYERIHSHYSGLCFNQIEPQSFTYALPVPLHIEQPSLLGVFRLKYRPHTKRTASWFANMQHVNHKYIGDLKLPEQAAKPEAKSFQTARQVEAQEERHKGIYDEFNDLPF